MSGEKYKRSSEPWPRVRLGEVVDFVRGVGFDKSQVRYEPEKGYLPILRAGNIGDELDLEDDLVWVPPCCVSADQELRAGDLAICMSSGSPTVVGKTAQLRRAWEGSVGAFCGIVRATSTVDPGFLGHFFRADGFREWRDGQARGANIQNLRFSQLAELEIPLPPLAEQRRIAGKLTRARAAVDVARRAAEQRLAAAESLSAAYLREVFEGPQASDWKVVSAVDIAKITGGVQKSPSRAPRKHHCAYLTVRNVQRGWLDLSQVERFEVTESELNRLRLCKGDILVVEGNGSPDQIGRNAVFDLDGADWIHQNHVIRVRIGEAATYQFVSLFLNSPAGKAQMVERARSTSGLYTLSVDKVGSLRLPLPPLVEQRRIAAQLSRRLEAADRLVAHCREELAAVEALPAVVLRAAFNGDTLNRATI